MLTISPNQAFPIREVLFTFALDAEAADVFQDHNHLICGIGKVSATYHLLKAIQEKKPALIVNLGSAGSNHLDRKSTRRNPVTTENLVCRLLLEKKKNKQ